MADYHWGNDEPQSTRPDDQFIDPSLRAPEAERDEMIVDLPPPVIYGGQDVQPVNPHLPQPVPGTNPDGMIVDQQQFMDPNFGALQSWAPDLQQLIQAGWILGDQSEDTISNMESWIDFLKTGRLPKDGPPKGKDEPPKKGDKKPKTSAPMDLIPQEQRTTEVWANLIVVASRTKFLTADSHGGGHAAWKCVKSTLNKMIAWMGKDETTTNPGHGYWHCALIKQGNLTLPMPSRPNPIEVLFINIALSIGIQDKLKNLLDEAKLNHEVRDKDGFLNPMVPVFWQGYTEEAEKLLRKALYDRMANEQMIKAGDEAQGKLREMERKIGELNECVKQLLPSSQDQ